MIFIIYYIFIYLLNNFIEMHIQECDFICNVEIHFGKRYKFLKILSLKSHNQKNRKTIFRIFSISLSFQNIFTTNFKS